MGCLFGFIEENKYLWISDDPDHQKSIFLWNFIYATHAICL